MRVTKHTQMHSIKIRRAPFVSDYNVKFVTEFGREIDCPANIPIDQFYALEHNLVNGFVDTSPDMLANPQAAAHLRPTSAEKPLPSDLSNDELFSRLVPRKLQSPAEIGHLNDLCPRREMFEEPSVKINEITDNE